MTDWLNGWVSESVTIIVQSGDNIIIRLSDTLETLSRTYTMNALTLTPVRTYVLDCPHRVVDFGNKQIEIEERKKLEKEKYKKERKLNSNKGGEEGSCLLETRKVTGDLE